jgi:hypothetical protein
MRDGKDLENRGCGFTFTVFESLWGLRRARLGRQVEGTADTVFADDASVCRRLACSGCRARSGGRNDVIRAQAALLEEVQHWESAAIRVRRPSSTDDAVPPAEAGFLASVPKPPR